MVEEAGVGRHLVYILSTDHTKLIAWAKAIYALEWLYLPSVALPKISILLLYLRIFIDRPARITTHILIWVLIAIWVSYLAASCAQCIPLEYVWNKKIVGRCFNQHIFWQTFSAPNFVTDIVMLVLPVKMFIRLRVSKLQKAGVILVFTSGSM